ncbi:sulfatase-like hydrolase/transferase [Coraliomargarita akajimensis]|uniref:Sulfatase n=1 Tax=Coraliomargarita akajimensis (strain DSM 45221 / IAM 15411 / JCM 23193 / KCTC 12865 / 04OKA010-24) TaxID=583355 RepID=D5ENZ1_CORAD|nr:sulfatase-like hydrolase/transferase [Coraliomargarita akajimensis]ADE53650.1 sulfatase [Coraliomargarita akajimensis DSM 45221]
MKKISRLLPSFVSLALCASASALFAESQPNIILIVADDISAREFPFYESSKWTGERLAKTPQMDQLAESGCFIETMWAATICKPSRVSMMNGTYSYQNKYWDNRHIGADCRFAHVAYESAPLTLGNVTRDAGYANIWVSKTHITDGGESLSMGFNECVFNPAETKRHMGWNPFGTPSDNPYPIFRSDDPKDWDHESFFWWPEMQLINHPDHPDEPYKYVETKIDDYAPDLEMEYIFEFMDRSKAANKPFFVLHTPHLGHLAKDYAKAGKPTNWPGTPVLEWKNGKYIRKDPKHIENGDGTYTRKNITPDGLSYHVEYLDYQMWQYIEKLKAMGELYNTIIIFSADNGTQDNAGNWGKARFVSQQGQHVPLLIYAPGIRGFVKGRQNIQVDFTDLLPTVAEIAGFQIPEDYTKLDGKSLWPYLTGKSNQHKDYIYSMRMDAQMIRNGKVMRDGYGTWYDVNKRAGDYDKFTKLESLPNGEYKDTLLAEKAKLEPQLAKYDLYNVDSEAPLPPQDSNGNGIADWFEEKYGPLQPNADPDGDGVNNFHEYVYGGDPTDPKLPSQQQLPNMIQISDAQGNYDAIQFTRRAELGPDYWFLIEGSADGQTWMTDGTIQQHSVRSLGNGLELVTARVAADKSKASLKELRVTVKKPKKRRPRKFENLL